MSDENNTSIVSKADLSSTPTTSDHESSAQENPDQRQQPQPELTRDSIYYFDPVVFKVEGVLFKVPKHGFMVPGSMFCDMFSLPIPEGQEAEGSDSNPISPPSVTQEEFSGFLSLMYPYLGRERPVFNYEGLAGALKLSTMWQYEKIWSNAICFLSSLGVAYSLTHGRSLAVKNVFLAQKYRSKKLLREGLLTLISEHVTLEDLRRHPYELDWETISRIFAAKTHLMKENRSFEIENVNKDLVRDYIDVTFKEDLEAMESESQVDAHDIEIFERFTSKRGYGDQSLTAPKTEVLSESVQERQTVALANPVIDRPHHIYYLETLMIRVENTLFRLPKVDFLHISNHIPPDTSALSFHNFLSAFYSIDESRLCNYDRWLDVLDLSTLLGLTEIRQKAIKDMYPLIKERNLIEILLLARKYKVKTWMIGALEGLANRRANPDMIQELREPFELDWITIAKILAIQCQSITVPTHLQRPDVCCRSCRLKQIISTRKVCAHACNTLALPIDDEEYTRFIEARDSGWMWSSDPESSEDLINLADSSDTIREMIKREFREEIMDWPQ